MSSADPDHGRRAGLRRWAGPVVLVLPAMLLFMMLAGGLPLLVVGFMVLCPAAAPSMALTANPVVGSVPPQKAWAASGLATTCNDPGISLGIAIIGSIGAVVYRAQAGTALPGGLPPEVAAAGRDSLSGAVPAAQGLPGELATAVLGPAPVAFADGLHVAAVVAAAGAAVVALRHLRQIPPTG